MREANEEDDISEEMGKFGHGHVGARNIDQPRKYSYQQFPLGNS